MNISLFVDLGVVLVLLISAGVSFFRGFIREVLTIFGMIGGLFAALAFGAKVKPLTHSWFGITEGKDPGKIFDIIPMTVAADVVAYGGIFLIVFIVLQLASYFLSSAVRALGLGPVDRTLGVFFGLARGVLLLGILYLPFNLILSDANEREWLSQSKTYFYVKGVGGWLEGFMPKSAQKNGDKSDVKEGARDKLKELDVLSSGKKAPSIPSIVPPLPSGGDHKDGAAAPTGPASSGPASSGPADGYSTHDRQGLDGLINKEAPSAAAPAPASTKAPNE